MRNLSAGRKLAKQILIAEFNRRLAKIGRKPVVKIAPKTALNMKYTKLLELVKYSIN
jgi:hypothetical protein